MLDEDDWQTLVSKIRAVACTPFIGAGACAGVLPMAGDLAGRLLATELPGAGRTAAGGGQVAVGGGPAATAAMAGATPIANPSDLAQVTQYLAVKHHDNSWPKLEIANMWRREGRPDFAQPHEPHAVLASLKLPLYLTTNYDDFMVSALRLQRGVTPTRELCRWNQLLAPQPSAFDAGYQPTPENPAVFHLHGHADVPDSIVVTEDDYLDFLVAISKDLASTPTVAGQRALLPLRVRSAIASTTLLFVGYSLSDVNFRVILRGLVGSLEPSSRRLSIAVQLPPRDRVDPERLKAYLDQYFTWTLNVRIFWGTAEDFARQLREHLD